MDYTPTVLRNKGVPVEFYEVAKNEETGEWEPVHHKNGKPKTVTRHIRFNHNKIADLEDFYAGLDVWQEAMAEKPVTTLRATLAIIFEEPIEAVGASFIEGKARSYNDAIGISWAICNGVDPTAASALLKEAEKLAKKEAEQVNELLAQLDQEDSPGSE